MVRVGGIIVIVAIFTLIGISFYFYSGEVLTDVKVSSFGEPVQVGDVMFDVHFNNMDYQVYVSKRPHFEYFMKKVASMFEVIVFTASQKVYADKLLNIVDPERNLIKSVGHTH